MALRSAISAALRAPFAKRAGQNVDGVDFARAEGMPVKFRNSADTADVNAVDVDADDTVLVADEGRYTDPRSVVLTLGVNGNQGSQNFWIAPQACRITGITEIHKTAGSDGSAVTAYVEKLTAAQAPGSGVSVMSGTFNLKGTAATKQSASLTTAHPRSLDGLSQDIFLAAGDRLAIVTAGVLTALVGVQITVSITPGCKGALAKYHAKQTADIVTQSFFIANRPHRVVAAYAVWGTAATDSGAVTLDIFKDGSGTAAGGGTSILSAAKSVKTTANTVATLSLTATAATLQMQAGDRLSVVITGVTTALADLTVVVLFAPIENRKEVSFCVPATDLGSDLAIFTADRDYEVIDVSGVWGTAATTKNATITRDTATTAPGGGTSLLTDNTNSGLDLSASAATPVWGTLAAKRLLWMTAGDRLSLKYAGATIGSLAGLCVTVSLRAR